MSGDFFVRVPNLAIQFRDLSGTPVVNHQRLNHLTDNNIGLALLGRIRLRRLWTSSGLCSSGLGRSTSRLIGGLLGLGTTLGGLSQEFLDVASHYQSPGYMFDRRCS
jgi:hypothetical protein